MKYRSGFKYQLAEDEVTKTRILLMESVETDFIILRPGGWLVIRAGYAWDGPSGPTWDSKNAMRASLIHDAIFQLIRLELIDSSWRLDADRELGRILKEDGMWWPRRKAWLAALKWLGGPAADPRNKKPVLEAP